MDENKLISLPEAFRRMAECRSVPELVTLAEETASQLTGAAQAFIEIAGPGFSPPPPGLTVAGAFTLDNGMTGNCWISGPLPGPQQPESALLTQLCLHTGACISSLLSIRQLQQQVTYLSDYDDLVTKLPNRKSIYRELNALLTAKKSPGQLALLFIDLDNLKVVNRQLGYQKGDQLLYAIAQRIAAYTGKRFGNSPARIGGDEFAWLITGNGIRENSAAAAQELLQVIRQPVELNYAITASIGISLFPEDAQTADTLFLAAEQAMFSAKDKGKDRFVFFSHSSITEKQGY